MAVSVQKFDAASITGEMIAAAAELFSQNYGVWGPKAAEKMGVERLKRGVRVKMSPKNVISQILPPGADNIYVRALVDEELVGNVFGTHWMYQDKPVIWITQLCVKSTYRSQGIAKKLVETLHENEVCMGILSSHAHAILSVMHVYGRRSEEFDLISTRMHARNIMDTCPVKYVENAKVWGSVFEPVNDGSVSCAYTNFWVDHEEPLKALGALQKRKIDWPLGELPEGHEFLIVVQLREHGLV